MKIFINGHPFDVMDYYRPHGFTELPQTPTMSGADIMARSGSGSNYHLIEENAEGQWVRDITRLTDAIPLTDGMKFATYPPAHF